jgi:uncharacterized protein YciI
MSQDFIRYVYLMSHRPGGRGTPELVKGHIAHLRRLDEQGRLVMCGPFKDYKGGMVVVKAESLDAARQIAESDPFIKEGFETYELRTWELACRENGFLG